MAKSAKREVEIQVVEAALDVLPEKRLVKSRNLVCVDLIWPRAGIARKSADFSGEPWAKRTIFREEIDGHSALAVSVTEPVTVQKLRRFARLTAKYALRMGADFMEKAMVGYADIASAPMDALSAMVGEKDAPKAIAQGVVDLPALPDVGSELIIEVPLSRPSSGSAAGRLTLCVRG